MLNPTKRLTAAQALDANYFWTEPYPAPPHTYCILHQNITQSRLPRYPQTHEYILRKRQHAAQPVQGPQPKKQKGNPEPSHQIL